MIRRAISCWRTVLFVHGTLLLFAFLFSLPTWVVVNDSVGLRSEGDLALWHDGGAFLADTIAREGPALAGGVRAVAWGGLVFALLAIPLSAGLFATLRAGRDLGPAGFASAATRSLGRFLATWFLFLVGLVVLAGAGGWLASTISDAFADTPDSGRGIVLGLLGALPFALLLLLLAAATDVARSVLASDAGRRRAVGTVLAAVRQACRHPLRFGAPYAAFGAAALSATLVAAALADRLGGRPGPPATLLLLVGQATLVVRAFLRAAWIGTASKLADAYLRAGGAGIERDRDG